MQYPPPDTIWSVLSYYQEHIMSLSTERKRARDTPRNNYVIEFISQRERNQQIEKLKQSLKGY